jgi:hypothetical protein
VAKTFHQRFFDAEQGRYAADSQTAPALALALGLCPGDCRRQAFDSLVASIDGRAEAT